MGRGTKIFLWLTLPVLLLVVLAVGAVAFVVLTREYTYVAFGSDQYNFTVRGTTTFGIKYALIQIDDGDDEAYVLLEAGELDHALRMFETAKTRQSSAWHDVEVLSESHERNPARLTVSAGTGVRFAILDDGVCLSYELAPADFAAFERAAMRARKHFDSDEPDRGLPYGNPVSDAAPLSAFPSTEKAMSEPAKHTNQGCR